MTNVMRARRCAALSEPLRLSTLVQAGIRTDLGFTLPPCEGVYVQKWSPGSSEKPSLKLDSRQRVPCLQVSASFAMYKVHMRVQSPLGNPLDAVACAPSDCYHSHHVHLIDQRPAVEAALTRTRTLVKNSANVTLFLQIPHTGTLWLQL